MKSTVSIEEKLAFLKWFLHTYDLPNKEAVWLLNHLLTVPKLLDHLHFVQTKAYSSEQRFIQFATIGDPSFLFIKGKMKTTDVERAYHHFRLHQDEVTLIRLVYLGMETCLNYARVSVDPLMLIEEEASLDGWEHLLAELFLDELTEQFQKERVYQEINRALENNDRETFMRLSAKWSQLLNKRS